MSHRLPTLLAVLSAFAAPVGAAKAQAPAAEPPPQPLERLGYTDYRGVIHAHSHFSHDSEGSDERIVQAAAEAGLDFLMMTDHQNDPRSVTEGLRGWRGRTLFVPGAEISIGRGSLLGLDLKRHVRGAEVAAKVADVLAQNGQAWAAHVEGWRPDQLELEGLAGMELYNLHYDAVLDGRIAGLWRAARFLRTDPQRALEQILDRPVLALKRWDRITVHRRFPVIAGNDSHENVRRGDVLLDPYPRSFRFVNTHVFVRGPLDVPRLREALAEGRSYICHEMFHDGRGFSFTALRGDDVRALLGEEIPFERGLELRVTSPIPAVVRLVRNGRTAASSIREVRLWSHRVSEPGVYRVELTILDRDGRIRPWIYSNPVYLR